MTEPRVLRLELSSCELEILTEVMCVRGCSLEEAARMLIAKHGLPRKSSNEYMRKYMRDYRNAQRRGMSIAEYRRGKR